MDTEKEREREEETESDAERTLINKLIGLIKEDNLLRELRGKKGRFYISILKEPLLLLCVHTLSSSLSLITIILELSLPS